MKNKNIKNNQQGHHDDCDDCRRQKIQNQALIAIYERLQAVDNNSKLMRKSLQRHQQQSEKTSSKFKDFVTKFNNTPQESKIDVQIQNLGLQLAQSTLHQVTKGSVARQNQRLKRTLARMYKNKNDNLQKNHLDKRSLSVNTDYQIQSQEPLIKNTQMKKSFFQNNDIDFKNSMHFQQIKQVIEPEQTRTTGFFSFQNQVASRANKMQGLNLWLYEGQNKSLQEELYETTALPRIKVQKSRRQKGSFLPTLRTIRYKM